MVEDRNCAASSAPFIRFHVRVSYRIVSYRRSTSTWVRHILVRYDRPVDELLTLERRRIDMSKHRGSTHPPSFCAAFHVFTNALCVLSAYFSALTSLTPTFAPSLVNTTFFFSSLWTPRSASSFVYRKICEGAHMYVSSLF